MYRKYTFLILNVLVFITFHAHTLENINLQFAPIDDIVREEDVVQTINETSKSELFPKPFFLMTMPKSGTGLIIKLLFLLTNYEECIYNIENFNSSYEEFESYLFDCYETKKFTYFHINDPNISLFNHYKKITQNHSQYVNILHIRDIRDIIISALFFFNAHFENHNINELDERLNYILNISEAQEPLYDISTIINISAKSAINWIDNTDAIIIKFEDIIGESGGGDPAIQLQTILSLAKDLGIQLSKNELDEIIENLFGIKKGPLTSHITFRSGQIGEWKKYFKPHHARLFNENWGEYQLALGYPLITEEEILALEQNNQEEIIDSKQIEQEENIDLEHSCQSDNE